MPEFTVQGKNVVFQIDDGAGFKSYVCCKSFTLQATSQLVEITTLTTGKYKDYELQSIDYTINLTGVFVFDTTQLGGGYIYNQQAVGGKMAYKAVYTDDNGSLFTITGACIVEDSILTATPGDVVGSDFVLKGCGEPAYSSGGAIDPADTLKSIFYIAEGGESFFSQIDFIGADMVEVMRNVIALEIITSGTPTGQQVTFDSNAGTLTFLPELGFEEYIQVIYST